MVAIGPVAFDGGVVIVSCKQPSSKLTLQLTDAFSRTFESIVYKLGAVWLMLLGVMLTAFLRFEVGGKLKLKLKPYLNVALKSVWLMFGLLVDQEDHRPRSQSSRLLWIATAIVVLVVIFGYFFNVVSTDLVAERVQPVITSLHDYITNDLWRNHLSYAFKMFFFYSYIQTAPESTLAHALYQRTQRLHGDAVIEATDMHQLGTNLMKMIDDMLSNLAAVFMEKFVFDHAMKPFLCSLTSDLGDMMYQAKDMIADGVTVMYFNKRPPPSVATRYEYNVRALFEGDVLRALTDTTMPEIVKFGSGSYTQAARRCVAGEVEKVVQQPRLLLASMRSFFACCGQGLLVALLVWTLEMMVRPKQCRLFKRIMRRRPRPAVVQRSRFVVHRLH